MKTTVIIKYFFGSSFKRMLLMLLFLVVGTTFAVTRTVSSIADLQTAINNSGSGDVIILANGTYLNNTFDVSHSNIIVRAATPGGVSLNGTNAITISGSNVLFSGFQFTSGVTLGTVQNNVIVVSGDYVTLTQLNFSGYNASKYINLQGQYDQVTYCNFEKKPITSTNSEKGNMIHIAQRSDLTPNYAKIRYCSFQKMLGDGGDYGNECIRITNHEIAEPDAYQSKTIVEHCYFTDTGLGDSEAISVKSDNNILRYNTMVNNQSANFSFRYGDDNVAYGNFFINSGGIRVKEANNIYCYNNYFENSGNGSVTAPVIFQYDNSSVVSHLNNLNFIHNTFVGGSPIQLGTYSSPNNGNVAITTFTNNTFANNIFMNSSGSIFSESTAGISFAGNIRSGTLGITAASGFTSINPQLVFNPEGYYSISSTSPAINSASASYPPILDIAGVDNDPNLLLDISRQVRPSTSTLKDVGCDQFTTEATTNHPLVLTEVGPTYLGGPDESKLSQTITFNVLSSKAAGIADFSPAATSSSGLPVSYTSSNSAVATIVNNLIHTVGVGSAIITASQAGNSSYNAAPIVMQSLTVTIGNHTINLSLPLKYTHSADFDPGASSSIGSPIVYTSSNPTVATIVDNKIHIVAKGTSTITATAAGNSSFNAATNTQQLIVQCSCVQ